MFGAWSLLSLIPIFLGASLAIWIAGVELSNITAIIDSRFKLGDALGGLILLAFATNLPEIAIVLSASLAEEIGIAIGNILGGIAIQTVVLVLLDGIGLKNKAGLTYQAASLQLVLEGTLVIAILLISIMGMQLPQNLMFAHIAPGDLLILITWLAGLWLINKARSDLPWHEQGRAPDVIHIVKTQNQRKREHWHTWKIVLAFTIAAIVTLAAGIVLEQASSAIANHIGWSGILFGSTILAAVTSLPEISTGLTAIKLGDYTLAVSDIFGGNAFLPVLFLFATLLSGHPVLSQAQRTDIYLASLGGLLTSIYIYGLIFRPKIQVFNLGIDSFLVLILYLIGTIGLFAI